MTTANHNLPDSQPPAGAGRVDVSANRSLHSLANRILRMIWNMVWLLLWRPSPRLLHCWRRFLLRLFGAKIGKGVCIYSSTKIWAPWNLQMDDYSCLAPDVDCYCVAPIRIGAHSTISQYSYLCAASHDFTKSTMPLIIAPIVIHDQAWVCADCFVGMGVTIGEGAVVGARSTVTKDVPPWMVVAGTPVRVIKPRQMSREES
jgi:putative colanic acid biosynthesis acetyltransferase WcaF